MKTTLDIKKTQNRLLLSLFITTFLFLFAIFFILLLYTVLQKHLHGSIHSLDLEEDACFEILLKSL